ncbi:integrase family protein [Simiduia sp. 21SJ11W-1]|uniref:tyrosine-type recombinase/integrase n=1 Tax=Simiduia sp. 21SJ11W-1 TaxID=2909669 RepID=UPI0020A172DA|nr:integrase family protein [Simiduia sp. 21SJ11W-1]UTA47442.1 integrase family protein [Simiduia sp. 21SJ11W-1]
MTDKKIRFTKQVLENLTSPEKGRVDYYDTGVTGLQIRISSSGRKTFALRKKVNGRAVRVTLGDFPAMTIDQARRLCAHEVVGMFEGINPNVAKRAERVKGVTLSECLDDYLSTRAGLADNTAKTYRQSVEKHLADWLNRPLKDITRDMVSQRHKRIAQQWPVAANNVMRHLRALFNFAAGQYEDVAGQAIFTDNPIKRISHNRQWTPEKRRQRIIKTGELPGWFQGVQELRQEVLGDMNEPAYVVADYLEFILLTGLRRDDALCLRWDQIELDTATMHPVIHKKQKEVIPLPLSHYTLELLKRRHQQKVNEYVFPGRYGIGRFDDPKKAIAKVVEATGIQFSSHDLRRTFITVAGSLDLSGYVVKRLCTHSISGDVTGGYIIFDAERLREPAQRVEDAILKRACIQETGAIIKLPIMHHQDA